MYVRKLFNRLIKRDSGFDWGICRNWKRRIFRRCTIQTVTLHRSASLYRMFSIIFLFRVINLFRFVFGSLSLGVTSHHLSFPAVFNLSSLNLGKIILTVGDRRDFQRIHFHSSQGKPSDSWSFQLLYFIRWEYS